MKNQYLEMKLMKPDIIDNALKCGEKQKKKHNNSYNQTAPQKKMSWS